MSGTTTQPEPAGDLDLDTDRPDFGAATTTVAKGHAVLETGYSFIHGTNVNLHTYPDAVLRVGVVTRRVELRLGGSFTSVSGRNAGSRDDGASAGAQDLYVGTKAALGAQRGALPETAVIVQATLPTGSEQLTSGRLLPGAVFLAGWDAVPRRLSFSATLEADRAVGDDDLALLQLGHAVTARYGWTPRLKTFVEWVALHQLTSPAAHAQHYVHPGVTFLVSTRVQLDVHWYVGINRDAVSYFGGPGVSVRF